MTPTEAAHRLTAALPTDTTSPRPSRDVAEWDDLRRGRARLDRDVLAAAAELARSDVARLVLALSGRDRPSVATIMAFLASAWSDEFGSAWISAATDLSMRALGAQTWVRQIAMTARSQAEIDQRLAELQVALATHCPADHIALWWQILAIAPRLELRQHGQTFILSLYDIASHVLAAAQSLPTEPEWQTYLHSNPCAPAVLPYVSQLGDATLAARCEQAYRTAVAAMLAEKDVYLPQGSTCADLYLESCGRVIAQTTDPDWWLPLAEELLGKKRRWNEGLSYEQVEKADWILSAACVAVVIEHREHTRIRKDLIAMIQSVAVPNLDRFFWAAGTKDRQRLAALLSAAFSFDPVNGASHIAQLAREVRSARLMCAVLQRGGAALPKDELAGLIDLLKERIAFYEVLRTDAPDE